MVKMHSALLLLKAINLDCAQKKLCFTKLLYMEVTNSVPFVFK